MRPFAELLWTLLYARVVKIFIYQNKIWYSDMSIRRDLWHQKLESLGYRSALFA